MSSISGMRIGGRAFLTILAAAGGVTLGACTRTLVPLGTTPVPLPPTPASEDGLVEDWAIPGGEISFSIFGIPPEGRLSVREPAGISGTVVSQLPSDLRDIGLTGQATPLGSSTWVEIVLPSGGTGWVNQWNLTEDVEPGAFCRDPRVPALLDAFMAALRDRSGTALAQTISPRRGLVLRHDWWNPEIIVSSAEAADLMQRVDEVEWGVQRGSGAPIRGSFRDRLLPELDALLAASPQEACDELLSGETSIDAEWPAEYARMNYVSYHVPAPETGTRFNWRSWAVGIEYVDGVPYAAILIRYQGDL